MLKSSSCWYLPWKGFQGSQIYLLHAFHSALKWKKRCLRCRDWAVALTGKHKEQPNLKRRLGMSFVKLSPLLFCLWSPSLGYGCSIVLYRLKRYLASINAWWKINSYCLCSRSWAGDVGTNLQPQVCPQLRNFGKISLKRKGEEPFITISEGAPHLWAIARNASAVLFLFSLMYPLQISTTFRILGRTVIKR